jgi:hypothetical protein
MNARLTEEQQLAVAALWSDLEALGGHQHRGTSFEFLCRELRSSYARAILSATGPRDDLWLEFFRLAVRVRDLAPRGLSGEGVLALRRLERLIAENGDLHVQVAALSLVV